ncbi:MAG: ABC transporter ATP-binding protein [Bryobacteraceae bacterium]|nr:ABC transporter ATP-binding protein [Bryobacteraceae bacterium]
MALEIREITKHFAARTAVDRVSLQADSGEFVVLLGPSGCGKSTLLRMIAGLETPDTGSILLDGREITRLDPRDRDIAMVFQSYALYPHMTIAANIGYPLRVRKRPPPEIAGEVEQVARRLGLSPLLNNKPGQLSGGERQRVALARAIIRRPKAFLMDEPLSNLDARLRLDMRAELKHLQHELSTVTVYVTHDQSEAMTLAHRIAVMRDGKLQQFDTPARVYHRPANLFVAGFVGGSPMNLIPGRAEAGEFAAPGIRVPCAAPAQDVTLGVRPEHVLFSAGAQPGYSAASVWLTEDLGSETLVRLKADSTMITCRAPGDFELAPGSPAWFQIPASRTLFFDSHTTQLL